MSSLCGERVRVRMALASAGADGLGTAWSAGVAVANSGAVLPPATTTTARTAMETKPKARAAKGQANVAANELIDFLNASPSPFHAVVTATGMLEKAGFTRLHEDEEWEDIILPGGKYYYTRHELTVVAFTLPSDWQPGRGLSIAGTHLDSPRLQVRPVSKKTAEGYLQVGIEPYGGGIWSTWFDRDLGLAGRVIVRDTNATSSAAFRSELVRVDRPLLRIPTLAPHLQTTAANQFSFNLESQFVPVLSQSEPGHGGKLQGPSPEQLPMVQAPEDNELRAMQIALSAVGRHHPELLEAVADELSVQTADIYELELGLYDIQPGTLGGAKSEFIFAPRMDNQFSTYCAVRAIIDSVQSEKAQPDGANVNVIMCFNHEEIGSVSTSGAASSVALSLLERLSPGPGPSARSIAHSFLISSDVGHAIHPSYPQKHERNHAPKLNGGVAIKTNARQSYTSEGVGTFIIKQLAATRNRVLQEYELPNDVRGGSTIGPTLSKTGIRTVDVGACLLSMHSIREQAGVEDVQALVDLFGALFDSYNSVADRLQLH